MKSDAVKVAEIQRQIAMIDSFKALAINPVLGLLLGLVIVENIKWDEKYDDHNRYEAKVWARSAVKTVALVEAIAPSIPTIAQATGDIVGSITKAVPGVAGLLKGGL